MARSLPSAFTTEAAKTVQKPLLLHWLVLPAVRYITSSNDGASIDGNTYEGVQLSIDGGIGPQVDWRGGLGSEPGYALRLIQSQTELTGTGADNSFEKFADTWGNMEFAASTKKSESTIAGEYAGATQKAWLVLNDGTPATSDGIKIFEGTIADVSFADYGELVVSFSSIRDGFLRRTFVNRLGEEGSGDENYDSSRHIYEPSDGKFVPIVYGEHPYARGLFVHATATEDDTAQSGLIICYSDIRWDTDDRTGDDPEQYVWDTSLEQDSPVLVQGVKSSGGSTGDQCEYVENAGTLPESGLSSGGTFVRWTDESGVSLSGAKAGQIIIERGPFAFSGLEDMGSSTDTGFENMLNKNQTFYFQNTDTTGIGNYDRALTFAWPRANYPGEFSVALLETEFIHITGAGGTDRDTRAQWRHPDESDRFAVDSAGSTWQDSSASFNNLFPATSDAADAIRFFSGAGLRNFADLERATMRIGIYYPSGTPTLPIRTDTAYMQVRYHELSDWNDHANKVYAKVRGIDDGTYTGGAGTFVETPSDIFYHFVEEVLGESGGVDTTAHATAYTGMSGDSLKMAINFVDDVRADEVLDKIAKQSMSWIVPDDDGAEKIIYRPGIELDSADAEAALEAGPDILAGTFRTSLTSREDVYAGVIVKYNYHWPSGEYLSEYRITPTGIAPDTNVSSPTEYTALADAADTDRDRIKTLECDFIYDDDTAEKLCKWYFQQHMRRRQICDFACNLEQAKWQPGDVLAINHPMVRAYSYGSDLSINHTTRVCDKQHGGGEDFWPEYAATGDPALVEHPNDVLIIEGAGPNAGTWRIDSVTDNDTFTLDSGHTLTTQSGTPEPWRVVPAQIVLSAKVVSNAQLGTHIAMRTVEFPILRSGASSF